MIYTVGNITDLESSAFIIRDILYQRNGIRYYGYRVDAVIGSNIDHSGYESAYTYKELYKLEGYFSISGYRNLRYKTIKGLIKKLKQLA